MGKYKTKFLALRSLFKHLRGPGGCPWDREQTHRSLIPYLEEESREVVRAIRKGDSGDLKEELADLLLQIMFHAQIAEENKEFDIEDVVSALTGKLIRRHPHVFGSRKAKTAEESVRCWERIKKKEKLKKIRMTNSRMNKK